MNNFFRVTLLLVTCSMFTVSAYASILEIYPPSTEATIGSVLTVDLNISGLGDGGAPSLGAFYAEINFDNTILNFDSVLYSSFLGDTDPSAFETDIITTSGTGFVSLDLFSFLFDFELDAIQSNAFTLATLTFSIVGTGTSTLDFGWIDLSTADGDSIFPVLAGASVTGISPVSVPEPNSIILLLIGIGLLVWQKKYFKFKTVFSYPHH